MTMKQITWELAVKTNNIDEQRQILTDRCNEAVMYFASNTALQLSHSQLMCDLMDVHHALIKGDLSEYLFNQANAFLNQLDEIRPQADALKNHYIKLAQLHKQLRDADTIKD